MEKLNQFVVSRALGSTMKSIKRPRFGALDALRIRNQGLAQVPKPGDQISFSPAADKTIVRAFEDVREGLPVDRVLADPDHAAVFFTRCRKLEVQGPDHGIALRLLSLRKSPRKHARIKKSTAVESHRSCTNFAYAAEIALSQIRYRFGASVDDILAYADVGREFDKLAAELHPGLSPLDYRLAALYVRKSRYCGSVDRDLFDSLRVAQVERQAKDFGSLDRLDFGQMQGMKGIVNIVEPSNHGRALYITQSKDVSETVAPFTKSRTLSALSSIFWTPLLSNLRLIVYDIHDQLKVARTSLWANKLISVKEPIFNYLIVA